MLESDRQLLEAKIARLAQELAEANAALAAANAHPAVHEQPTVVSGVPLTIALSMPTEVDVPPPPPPEVLEEPPAVPALLALDEDTLPLEEDFDVAPSPLEETTLPAPVVERAERPTLKLEVVRSPALEEARAAERSIEEMFAEAEARLRPRDALPPAVWYRRPVNIGLMVASVLALVLSVKVAMRDDPAPQTRAAAPKATAVASTSAPAVTSTPIAPSPALQARATPPAKPSRARRR